MKIIFRYINIKFRVKEAGRIKEWLSKVLQDLGFDICEVEYSFISEKKILQINKEFLKHNYTTDIITFCYENVNRKLLAEFFICPGKIKENAILYDTTFEEEIRRVLVHGLLHCAEYNDCTEREIISMRKAENKYLKAY